MKFFARSISHSADYKYMQLTDLKWCTDWWKMYWAESVHIRIVGYPQVSSILKLTDPYLYCSDLFTFSDFKALKIKALLRNGANMHSDIFQMLSLAGPWNEGVHSMHDIRWHAIRWHEHTGNAVESLAKSTTSGSSSNMLFSIMFLGRLARSNVHRVREIRQITFKMGEMSKREERIKMVIGIGTNTQLCMLTYVLRFGIFRVLHRKVMSSSGNKAFFNTKAYYCH